MIRSTLVKLSSTPVGLPTNGARSICLSQPYVGTTLTWPVRLTVHFDQGEAQLLAAPGVVYDFGRTLVAAWAHLPSGSGTYLLDVADEDSTLTRPNASPGDAPVNSWSPLASNPAPLAVAQGSSWECDFSVPVGATGGALWYKAAASGTPIIDFAFLDDSGLIVVPYGFWNSGGGRPLALGATTVRPAALFGVPAAGTVSMVAVDGAMQPAASIVLPDVPPRTLRAKVANSHATAPTVAGAVSLWAHWYQR